jgi:hypothetical protein
MAKSRSAAAGAGFVALGMLLVAEPAASSQKEELTVYVAANGLPSGTGLSATSPVASLEAAQDAARRAYHGQQDIRVKVAPGTYTGQHVLWTWRPDTTTTVTIEGSSRNALPIFDGGGGNMTWAAFRTSPAPTSNITIRNISIKNYRTAIIFAPAEGALQRGSNELIENNRFEHIGQFSPGRKPAYSIIGLDGISNSVIRANHFSDIANVEGCGGLHVVYLAHHSSNNRIEDNRLENVCADAFKARDGSDNNQILNNTFVGQRGAFFVDSYCDPAVVRDCQAQECPSFGNVVRGNIGEPLDGAQKIRIVHRTTLPGCPAAQSDRVLQ